MVCLECGVIQDVIPQWALTDQDVLRIENTKKYDEDREVYVITKSPSQIGWERYWEHTNFILAEYGITLPTE